MGMGSFLHFKVILEENTPLYKIDTLYLPPHQADKGSGNLKAFKPVITFSKKIICSYEIIFTGIFIMCSITLHYIRYTNVYNVFGLKSLSELILLP